jgi:hypothetical protein
MGKFLDLSVDFVKKLSKSKVEKISKNLMITGDVTNQVLISPPVGKSLRLQVLLIVGEGNTGEVMLYRSSDSVPILPLWMSTNSRSNTSNELNMLLNVGETLRVTTIGRGSNNDTFIGVGYDIE